MSALAIAWSRRALHRPTAAFLPGEVHLWRARRETRKSPPCPDVLDPAERARAHRLILPARRQAFVFSRTMLRNVLGAYLSVDPARVPLVTADRGKPHVSGQRLRCSLSHSGDWLLLAVAEGSEIGVDLEAAEGALDAAALAAVSLSDDEQARLAELGAPERWRAVLRIWTRKEALLKAAGSGLACDPRRLTLPPALPACVHHSGRDWTLTDIPFGGTWQASLAIEGQLGPVRGFCVSWDESKSAA